MADVRRILGQVAAEEALLRAVEFLAPRVANGPVRVRVDGLACDFAAHPASFEGWGVFRATSVGRAQLVRAAGATEVSRYLSLLGPVRVRLVHALAGQSWLAYPGNESDARQKVRAARPLVVHLAAGVSAFEAVVARWDGASLWFEEVDRRADPRHGDRLVDALRQGAAPESLAWSHLTPEMRTAYRLAFDRTEAGRRELRAVRDEGRLRDALRRGGGHLESARDHGFYWTVEWTTGEGERHSSAIRRSDLTVMSAGVCLSGRDRDFDLESLVGVVEGAWTD